MIILEEASKVKFIFMIFALVIFFVLTGYIIASVVTIFKQSKTYTESTTKSSLGCTDYNFNIRNIKVEEGTLYFDLSLDSLSRQFSTMIVEHSSTITKVDIDLLPGEKKRYGLKGFEGSSFSVYPSGCATYKKSCSTITASCN